MSEKALEGQEKVAKEPETTVEVSKEKFMDRVGDLKKKIDAEEDEMNSNEHFNTSEKVATVVARVMAREFKGPIPSPDILAEYENIFPGFADRIISMAERQSSHRQEMEKIQTNAEGRDSLLGVIFAFLLGFCCIVACVIMVINVPNAAGVICGSIIGVTGISAIVGTFLKNTRKSNGHSEREKEE